MAVIWESCQGDDHYQVRTAGRSVRLYKNQVFHSQWNESRPLSSGVWDLLFLPALLMPENSVKRVLVLGVGGGAVIRQYTTFLPIEHIVGVELDPLHLHVAREHFGLKQSGVELIEANAIDWVKSYRGAKFDVVIEDLFTEADGEPVRVMEASTSWFRQLRKLLHPEGTLIINFEDPAQLRASNQAYVDALSREREGECALDSRFALSLPTYGNCVGAYLSINADPKLLRKKLDTILTGYPACRSSAQKFRIRRIHAK